MYDWAIELYKRRQAYVDANPRKTGGFQKESTTEKVRQSV